jgi:hypothetical protein
VVQYGPSFYTLRKKVVLRSIESTFFVNIGTKKKKNRRRRYTTKLRRAECLKDQGVRTLFFLAEYLEKLENDQARQDHGAGRRQGQVGQEGVRGHRRDQSGAVQKLDGRTRIERRSFLGFVGQSSKKNTCSFVTQLMSTGINMHFYVLCK